MLKRNPTKPQANNDKNENRTNDNDNKPPDETDWLPVETPLTGSRGITVNDKSRETEQMGERIKKLRLELYYTQRQLAELVGVNSNTISNYENGKTTNMGVETFMKLAYHLKTTVGHLYAGRGN